MTDLRVFLIQFPREPFGFLSLELLRPSPSSAVHCRLPLNYKLFLHALLRTATPLLLKVGETRHGTGNSRSKSELRTPNSESSGRGMRGKGMGGLQTIVAHYSPANHSAAKNLSASLASELRGSPSDVGFRASDFEAEMRRNEGAERNPNSYASDKSDLHAARSFFRPARDFASM